MTYRVPTLSVAPCCDRAFPRAVVLLSFSNSRASPPAQSPPAVPAQTAADASAGVAPAIPACQSSARRKAGCPYQSAAALSLPAFCSPFAIQSCAELATIPAPETRSLPRRHNSKTTPVPGSPPAPSHKTTTPASRAHPHLPAPQSPRANSPCGPPHLIPVKNEPSSSFHSLVFSACRHNVFSHFGGKHSL